MIKTLSANSGEIGGSRVRSTGMRLGFLVSLLFVCANSAAFGSSSHRSHGLPHALRSSPSQYSGCPGSKAGSARFGAIDFSQPADEVLIRSAKAHGVTAVLRYYDWKDDLPDIRLHPRALSRRSKFNRQFHYPWRPGPQFHGKILTGKELAALHKAGLKVGVVFQHFSSDPRTFTDAARAHFDANQALDLARHLPQPPGTIIFFGVDLDASPAIYPHVRRYFASVRERLKTASFKLGVYGNGYVCNRLLQDGLVTACWLSQSVRFRESVNYERKGSWIMKQCATRKPFPGSTIEFDPDVIEHKESGLFW